MRELRDPETGCPWDLEQSFDSIAPYTIEEAYEVEDAIRRRDFEELRSELGDLLLQVVYHSQLAEEQGSFALDDVVEAICTKLIDRHPHVFGSAERPDHVQPVLGQWEARKAAERRARGATSAFDEIPLGLPALTRAAKLARRARNAALGEDPESSLASRLEDTLGPLDSAGLGRALGALARLASRAGLDPETALRDENARVERLLRASEANALQADASAATPEPTGAGVHLQSSASDRVTKR